ncbi:MAG: TPM domain-containing protein [Clostridia bacterium]|nr:TPM domain-containing protein [Clostridia bacterium]
MKKTKLTVRSFALIVLVCTVFAMAIPVFAYPAHTDYIADSATIIDENTENSIKSLSNELLEEKNVRIALCTVLNTEGKSLAQYASAVYKEWNVGHGVLILIVTEADSFFAVQSNSVADVLTSGKLSDIINTTMEPRFAEKDYSGAAMAAANAIASFLKENLADGIGEDGGGLPVWLSVILKIILVLAIIVVAGYCALVYLERKQAEKRRLAMEARRRRIAEDGRGRRPMPPQGYSRPNGQRPDSRYPLQNGQRPNQNYPVPNGQRAPQGYGRVAPEQRYDDRATQNMRASMERTGTYAPAQARRNVPERYDDNAATVQISTADIRAVRGGRDKYGDR